ncbi:MAG: enoyl-CoA hydratase/isomerase family protein [Desulfuromonadaceae bacterium]|nr:enoyl-CoA hydratase/isomerase family protein [Desulfuromonadaceae bacterium]MDD5107787.1 enoyl-CoA hydratase/isomerase family protein [Desulfuromonadaceae bacterium]
MSNTSIIVNIDNRGVATLTMNRPELHNAFDDTLIADLTSELHRLEADHDVRVVLLRANGKSFSAGADLNWMRRMADYSYEQNLADAMSLAELMRTLDTLTKPTIALVHGAAYGGGVGLVACCDIAIATERASFCLSEVKLGLFPAIISPYVVAAIGPRAARRYFLSAEAFSAAEAHRIGLIHQIVEDEHDLAAVSDRLAATLLLNSPAAVAGAKELVAAVAGRPVDVALIADTAGRIADQRSSHEGKEGLSAFLEKRRPAWVKE